ncbi:MAG TPA: M1 family metallopeptidase [Bryobacteraceae bacterium]|nr:M1 family metallopeptidase [Bryobacteraceae bacterium]
MFRLTLSDSSDEIEGSTTVTVRFLADGVTQIALDLASAANGKGMTVTEVTSTAGNVQYRHEHDRLVLSLSTEGRSGEKREFTVRYHGVPASGLRIGNNKYGERTFFSQNWPDLARQWLPTVDHPYDKASSEFIVIAPSKYQVVANGSLEEELDLGDGRRSTHWRQSVPIATWLNDIGVAQFSARQIGAASGVPLQTWVYHQDRDAGMATFDEPARQAMEFYCDHIGPYPYAKLANVEAAGVNGGMEHASAIFYGEKSVTMKPAVGLVAHEVAHQWFGDSVTEKDWDDVWLSEGFATYFALLTAEHYQGRDAFIAGLKTARDRIFALEKRSPELTIRHNNLSDMGKVLNQMVYQKGGWTLHMLRGVIGTEKFWAGIRAYYQTYRDGNASTDDFRRVMEDASGMELGWFFQQWLNRPGFPVIDGSWHYDPEASRIIVDLAQTQPGEVYRLPVEIGAGPFVEKVEMTQKTQHFEIKVEKEPPDVTLDPKTWVLMDAHFAKRN